MQEAKSHANAPIIFRNEIMACRDISVCASFIRAHFLRLVHPNAPKLGLRKLRHGYPKNQVLRRPVVRPTSNTDRPHREF